MTEDVNAQLVFEFVIVVEGEKGLYHEITCGHANFSIMNGDYQNQKNYELYLMGGSLTQPVDIPQEDIIFNRQNVVGKLGMLFKGVPKPHLSLRISLVTSPKGQQKFCHCPPNVIMELDGCEIVTTYRKMLAKKLFPTRVLDDRMIESNCCELRWFPHIMDDHELWLLFLEKWKVLLTASRKTKDKKPHERLLSKLVKDVYSVKFCTNIPRQVGRQSILSLFYDNPKEILNSNGLIFKPFDASETILKPIFNK
ncbi:predicted protein [Naegleria gruberi]|uniref:Predicted protein n=1 Tax=Naegleria gruberi TaxID=5762 RepID=D2VQC4_NAEGR|nr:uncharacterized protein NAEGRDRAFT_71176 [Naegleria gruberi]EFC40922.1 predicted protein [Naegleria gruberi]|eukprot:XP_002673666.1 predicted protein [Naegleria gruberi strain NEG-M]